MSLVDVAVGKYDVVVAVVNAALCLLAQTVEGLAQSVFSLCALEEYRQLHGIEALVAYVAQNVELGVVKYRVRQTHHLAVCLVWNQYSGAHTADILRQRHYEILAYRVDGGVGNLCKLLAEVVEEHLRTVAQHRKRRVVAH